MEATRNWSNDEIFVQLQVSDSTDGDKFKTFSVFYQNLHKKNKEATKKHSTSKTLNLSMQTAGN